MRRPVGVDARRCFRELLGPAGSHRRTAQCIQPRSVQPGPFLAWGSACVSDCGECASACSFSVARDKEVVPLVAWHKASFGSVWFMQRWVSLHFPSGPIVPSALGGMPSQAATTARLHACRHPALSLLLTQAGLALGRSPPFTRHSQHTGEGKGYHTATQQLKLLSRRRCLAPGAACDLWVWCAAGARAGCRGGGAPPGVDLRPGDCLLQAGPRLGPGYGQAPSAVLGALLQGVGGLFTGAARILSGMLGFMLGISGLVTGAARVLCAACRGFVICSAGAWPCMRLPAVPAGATRRR